MPAPGHGSRQRIAAWAGGWAAIEGCRTDQTIVTVYRVLEQGPAREPVPELPANRQTDRQQAVRVLAPEAEAPLLVLAAESLALVSVLALPADQQTDRPRADWALADWARAPAEPVLGPALLANRQTDQPRLAAEWPALAARAPEPAPAELRLAVVEPGESRMDRPLQAPEEPERVTLAVRETAIQRVVRRPVEEQGRTDRLYRHQRRLAQCLEKAERRVRSAALRLPPV